MYNIYSNIYVLYKRWYRSVSMVCVYAFMGVVHVLIFFLDNDQFVNNWLPYIKFMSIYRYILEIFLYSEIK